MRATERAVASAVRFGSALALTIVLGACTDGPRAAEPASPTTTVTAEVSPRAERVESAEGVASYRITYAMTVPRSSTYVVESRRAGTWGPVGTVRASSASSSEPYESVAGTSALVVTDDRVTRRSDTVTLPRDVVDDETRLCAQTTEGHERRQRCTPPLD